MGDITARTIKRLAETVRLLLLEDDALVIEATQTLIESNYLCKVDVFQSIDAARSHLESLDSSLVGDYYSLAIIDLYVQNQKGTDIIRWLKQYTDTPCIVVTGFPGSEYATEAANLGVVGLVAKPLDVKTFDDIFKTYRLPKSSRLPASST